MMEAPVASTIADELSPTRRPRWKGLIPPPESGWAAALPLVPTLLGAMVWWVVLRSARLDAMNDVGLVSIVPVIGLLALALPTVGFCWSLAQRTPRSSVLLVHVIALIIVLHGVPAIVEDVTGLRVAWRHVGVAQEIAVTGEVDPRVDAYFNWPGFFAVLASLTEAAGVSTLSLARLAPMGFHLAYLPALLLILRGAGADRRLAWLAVWVFELANWVAQDYLAPQAEAYLIYLVVLALLLGWFTPARSRHLNLEPPPEPEAPAGKQQAGLMAAVVIMLATLVASHQLTPFALLACLVALLAARRLQSPRLPILLGLMLAAWLAFPASDYVAGHVDKVTGRLGGISLDERITGSSGHLLVVRLRLAATAVLAGAALAGWWHRRRRGRDDTSLALLGAAPPALAIIQPYGGEILMRVYLFALPAMAFFVAAALLPRRWGRRSWRGPAALVVALVGMTALFLFTRYGNQRVDRFSSSDVAAVQALYAHAPPESLLLAATQNLPWKGQGYTAYRYLPLERVEPPVDGPGTAAATVVAELRGHPRSGAYYIVTESIVDDQAVMGALPDGALAQIEAALRRAPDFDLIYDSDGARIYTRNTSSLAAAGDTPGGG